MARSEGIGTTTEKAYCAGIIDADGTVGVHVNWYRVKTRGDAKQPTYQPRITVAQVDTGAIELLEEIFGGYTHLDRTSNLKGSGRPIHRWSVHSASCRRVIEAVRPYMRIKHRQADLALELCDLNASARRRVFDVPEIIEGEPLLPLAEAARRAGRHYSTAAQCVKLGNIPFVRRPRVKRGDALIWVPESFVEIWRTRGRSPLRTSAITARMADINDEIKALNSGARGQSAPTSARRD